MDINAEKLFFRYKTGDVTGYSDQALINFAAHVGSYKNILKCRHEKFVLFLMDLPPHLFSYYLHSLEHYYMDMHLILEHPLVIRKKDATKKEPLMQTLMEHLHKVKEVNFIEKINGNTCLISLDKRHLSFKYQPNMLVSLHAHEIVTLDIPGLGSLPGKASFLQSKEFIEKKALLIHSLQHFQEKNRLKLLFVS